MIQLTFTYVTAYNNVVLAVGNMVGGLSLVIITIMFMFIR